MWGSLVSHTTILGIIITGASMSEPHILFVQQKYLTMCRCVRIRVSVCLLWHIEHAPKINTVVHGCCIVHHAGKMAFITLVMMGYSYKHGLKFWPPSQCLVSIVHHSTCTRTVPGWIHVLRQEAHTRTLMSAREHTHTQTCHVLPNEYVFGTLIGVAARSRSYEYLTTLIKKMLHLEVVPNDTILEILDAAATHTPNVSCWYIYGGETSV